MDKKTYIRTLIILLLLGLIEVIAFAVYENIYFKKAVNATNTVAEPGNYNDCESLEQRAGIHNNSFHFSGAHFKMELVRDYDKYSNGYPYEYKLSEWAWVIFQLQKDDDGDVHSFTIYPTTILSKHRLESGIELIQCLNKAYTTFCEKNIKGKVVTTKQSSEIWDNIIFSVNDNPVYIYEKVNCNHYLGHPLDFDDYRVIIEGNCGRKYSLQYNYSYRIFKNDFENGSLWIFASLFVLFTILRITDWKTKKDKFKSSQYYKLKMKCNPANFMKPYQKEKVDKANEIYKILMKTNPKDIETLNRLELRIEDELNISRIDNEELRILTKKCNPQNFMSPYIPEKVALANEIYSQLMKKNLAFEEYEALKEKSTKLFNS